MKDVCLKLVIVVVLTAGLSGCGRDAPPEIPDFRIPAKIALVDSTVPEVVADPSAPMAPTPAPLPKGEPTKAPVLVAKKNVAAPTPTPAPEAPLAPSIVGTWQITEMARRGQSQPLPAGMQMTLTFAQDGSLTMSVSGGQMPQANTQQGTYTLTGNQITINLHNQAKSGTCTFEGDNKITIEIDEAKMTMTRT
jgi:hypothetical protein